MDVRCERCSTEYEFDDALVSGRGTTVKCTNCGYKFKIRRSDGDYSEDFWNVTAGDGRTLVFTSLRELQRAIQSYLVDRHDRLSRGGLPPKPIGEIPELAPFFEQRERKATSGRPQRTQDGIGPISSADPESSTRSRQATKPEFPAPPPEGIPSSDTGKTTLIGTGPRTEQPAFQMNAPPPAPQNVTVPPPTTRQAAPPVHVDDPARRASVPPPVPARREASNTVPLQRSVPPAPPPRAPSVPPPLPHHRKSQPSQPMAEPVRATSARPRAPSVPPPLPAAVEQPYRPPPRSLLSEVDDQQHSDDDDSGEPSGLPRRRSTGLVVGVALAGAVAILGGAWAKKNLLAAPDAKTAAPVASVDPRVATFLAAGEKALSDGSLDLAKESFDKASALAEKDPKVLLGLARLAAIRADSAWLKARLLPADATDEERVNRDALGDLAATARNAADAALAVAPDDSAAVRAKIDAARISGDRNGARALVSKIGSSATQSESAYVLAALDLTEEQPSWSSVIERLKLAASTESGAGRARAALVYALARSGDVPASKAELERLSAMPKAHPLLPLLRAYTDRAKPAAHADAGAVVAAVASGAAPAVAAAATPTPAEGQEPSKGAHKAGGLPTDARELLQQGERARAKGDYDRAKTLFEAAIEKNPSDSEALAGLGAIAYAQHDLNGARSAYKRVIGINPNYMPAVIGLADVEWDSGDRATATRMYKDIVDRYPEGAYPGRVKQRAEGGG